MNIEEFNASLDEAYHLAADLFLAAKHADAGVQEFEAAAIHPVESIKDAIIVQLGTAKHALETAVILTGSWETIKEMMDECVATGQAPEGE